MKKRDFLRVIFLWSLLQYGQSFSEDDLPARMTTLEQEVHELENEAITRNEVIRLLSQGVTQLTYEGQGNPNTGENEIKNGNENKGEETTPTGDKVTSPITVVEARREMVGDRVKFTVKYKYDADGLTIVWFDIRRGSYRMLDYTDNILGDGTRETSTVTSLPEWDESSNATEYGEVNVTTAYSYEYPFKVAVSLMGSNGGIRLEMVNAEGDDVQTDISPLPVFKVEPSGEFVYEEGEDVSFTITFPPKRHEGEGLMFGSDPIHFQLYLVDLGTGEQRTVYGMSDFLERVGNESFPEYREWDMKLKTSEMKYSGVVTVAIYDVSLTETNLVNNIWQYKSATLRPSTQDGPFPSGYLDFFKEPWVTSEEQDDGTREFQVVCSGEATGGQCDFFCMAAGDDISDVKIYRMESDGTKTPVSELPQYTTTVFAELNEDLISTQVAIPINATTGKDSERFSCVAKNALGKTATLEIVAYYHYTSPQILRKESEIQILNPNEASMTLELKVVCKVQGYPRPNVTFSLYTWGTSDYGTVPDEVIEDGNGITTAVKFMTYDLSDPYGYNGGYGKLSSVSCTAEIGGPFNGYDYYDIPIPAELEGAYK